MYTCLHLVIIHILLQVKVHARYSPFFLNLNKNNTYCCHQNEKFNCLLFIPTNSHVVLYGCETWSATLREERRLRVFENRVLRRIFGPRRDEVTGELRKLHNEKLNDLYCSPNIVLVIK